MERVPPARLEAINEAIRAGGVRSADGSPVDAEISEALITSTGTTIYPVEDGIPIMLEDRSIPALQFDSLP